MRTIPEQQILGRIRAENPWWDSPNQIPSRIANYRTREYLRLFLPLVKAKRLQRAVVLMGPRRVGKTVMLHHTIQDLLETGIDPSNICFLSVDHPIYNGLRLEQLVEYFLQASGGTRETEGLYVFFDEIQYLRDWEVHLKVLVDEMPGVRFVASGSAAAALKLKSAESGAGRFTDFLLPPLTFHEYLSLQGIDDLVTVEQSDDVSRPATFEARDVNELNKRFLHYLNYGGYPEVIFSKEIQADPQRFIKSDIIDKVLLRDLPSLYGIADVQELNYLFTTLAYNTANEVSLDALSQNSGVAKNTIKRYIEYLEAAFLIRIVHRIDKNAKRFKRANFFKVYLTNPSIRSALFSPITIDDEAMGALAETAVFAQWFHESSANIHYARWQKGEVDIVWLEENKPRWAVEVKWSDRYYEKPAELKSLIAFCHANQIYKPQVTTRTKQGELTVQNVCMRFVPASLYCYTVGYNLIRSRKK